MSKGLLLIDGNGIAYRVATGKRNTGQPTVVLYQMTQALLELSEAFDGWVPILFFDGGYSALREAIYPAYKGNRTMTPERRRVGEAIGLAKQALLQLGKPFASVEGCEADDLISIVAVDAEARGVPAIIVSDDRDLYQVLGQHVAQFVPRLNQLLTMNEALAEWSGSTTRYLLWKALNGDDGDNIDGVPGIGEVYAHQLVALCKGRAAWLYTEEAKRALRGKKWAEKVWSPEGRRQLALAYKLVRTARSYPDLMTHGDAAEAEVRRVLGRHQLPLRLPVAEWNEFTRTFDVFPLIAQLPQLERLYAFRVDFQPA